MIYEFELSYKEIAAVLDLSDARVCQLNKSALAKMKAALGRAEPNKRKTKGQERPSCSNS
jgi:DNA-directed RNA polymerase specialized sigma24 family protein